MYIQFTKQMRLSTDTAATQSQSRMCRNYATQTDLGDGESCTKNSCVQTACTSLYLCLEYVLVTAFSIAQVSSDDI